MFKGYNTLLSGSNFNSSSAANEYVQDIKQTTHIQMDTFFTTHYDQDGGFLDGFEIIENIFPSDDDFHIFISHAHADENIVNSIVYELHKKEIKSFVDSHVWGYMIDLLKIIDNKYCKNHASGIYNYNKRNISTSHVHMMLSTALNRMIDECECFMFLNTENSIQEALNRAGTFSPWIMSELVTSNIVRKKKSPRREQYAIEARAGMEHLTEDSMPRVHYPVDCSHLTQISENNLAKWINRCSGNPFNDLDLLYHRHSS